MLRRSIRGQRLMEARDHRMLWFASELGTAFGRQRGFPSVTGAEFVGGQRQFEPNRKTNCCKAAQGSKTLSVLISRHPPSLSSPISSENGQEKN